MNLKQNIKRFIKSLEVSTLVKRILPLLRQSKEQLKSVSLESKVRRVKNISFRKADVIVLIILIIFVSTRSCSKSRKEERCRKLKELASEYTELIDENRSLAKKYESEGDAYLNRYGDVQQSIQGAVASGLMSLRYSVKADKYAGRLKEVKKEMAELGCD